MKSFPSHSIIWIFSPDDHLKEKDIFDQKKCYFEEGGIIISPRGGIVFLQENTTVYAKLGYYKTNDKLPIKKNTVIVAHKYEAVEGIDCVIKHGIEVIDYSSSDGASYHDMLSDYNNVFNKDKLLEVVEKWMNFYRYDFKLDPIQRLKHRTLNLFAHILIDLQTIQTLCVTHELSELAKVSQDLKKEWERKGRTCHSPQNELKRLHYLLVGDKLKEEQRSADVLLLNFRGEKKTLYDWLIKLPKHDEYFRLPEWKELLKVSGLLINKNGHVKVNKSGIVKLCNDLEHLINNLIEYRSSDFSDKINNLVGDFSSWIQQLSGAFDKLKKTIVTQHEPELANH